MSKSEFIFNKVNKILEWFLIIIFALLVLDVLFQVFSRYLLGRSFTWTEEFARFSLIWMTVLGAAYLNAKNIYQWTFYTKKCIFPIKEKRQYS